MIESLIGALEACRGYLPEDFRASHARLFEPEPLARLAARLLEFRERGVPDAFPPPHLVVEETPPYAEAFAPFRESLSAWDPHAGACVAASALAGAMLAAGTRRILVLLGQRQTPGSLVDERAIPPSRDRLLAAAARPFRGDLTAAGRALAKHVHRVEDGFWGEVRGSGADQSRAALRLVESILDDATWWNVFEHYKHAIVFETREPRGHGARWGEGGDSFIGFLEPFTPDFPRVRD